MQLASLPDAQLVARCRGGDEDAWRELVSRFSRYVFAICSQAFRLRAEDSEEVFQEVFARTYQHLAKLRDDEAIRPWIGQLTRRLCIDHLRSSSREEIVDPETLPGGVDEAMTTLDDAFAVHEAMAELMLEPISIGSQTTYRSRKLTRPGLYTLTTGNNKLPIAVNVPATEADIRPIDGAAIRKTLGDVDIEFERDQLPPVVARAEAGNDFGWSVMMIVLAMVSLECFLAMKFGHYRRGS